MLVRHARAGRYVVRLKGGDPFLFGRGGEEAQACREGDVPVEVVPGVTSALAVPAAAGIPATHRGVARQVTVISGHDETVDWDALAHGEGTLILLMAVRNLERIATRLIAGGKPASTPVAVIEQGTMPGQRTTVADLATIAVRIREVGARPPAVIVIGDVVNLRSGTE